MVVFVAPSHPPPPPPPPRNGRSELVLYLFWVCHRSFSTACILLHWQLSSILLSFPPFDSCIWMCLLLSFCHNFTTARLWVHVAWAFLCHKGGWITNFCCEFAVWFGLRIEALTSHSCLTCHTWEDIKTNQFDLCTFTRAELIHTLMHYNDAVLALYHDYGTMQFTASLSHQKVYVCRKCSYVSNV